jgi:hypothetical protein
MTSRGTLVVATNCSDPAREEEYRRWYLSTHLPDVLEVPGVVGAQLYENVAPKEGEARYTAIYQIEGDPEAVVAELRARGPQLAERGRLIDCASLVSMQTLRALG